MKLGDVINLIMKHGGQDLFCKATDLISKDWIFILICKIPVKTILNFKDKNYNF